MRDYWSMYKNWSPKRYDARSWVSLMKRAGVKYFDFTTKHHEGFSMYDTHTVRHYTPQNLDAFSLSRRAAHMFAGCFIQSQNLICLLHQSSGVENVKILSRIAS